MQKVVLVLIYEKKWKYPPYEVMAKCPYCDYVGETTIVETNGTCVVATTICLVLVCCPCFAWMPLCCNNDSYFGGCKNVEHYCNGCHMKIGISSPIGIK